MPTISVSGGEICYDTYGRINGASSQKPWLVVFPGMGMFTSAYRGFAEQLSDVFQVLVVGYRGIPPSSAPLPVRLTIKSVLEDTRLVFKHLGINRCHVIGESYGGMVALGLAEFYPNLVDTVFIVNSSLAGKRSFRLHPKALLTMGAKRLKGVSMWQAVAEAIFSKTFQQNHPSAIVKWVSEHEKNAYPHRTALAQALAAAFYYGRGLKSLSCNVAIIYGTADTFVDPINSQKIHQSIPQAVLTAVAGAGHHLLGETPKIIADIVRSETGVRS